MNDNDIIKALECCRDCKCKECPCYKNIEGEMRCTEIDEEEILDLINRQKADKEKLEHILMGVMHSVDKWLEGDELKQDEVNRAATMREKTLQIVEQKQAEIEKLKELIDTMGDYFPACIGCEGKTELGERTDKCIYLIDTTNYCSQRGISNIMAIVNENHSLKAEVERLNEENKEVHSNWQKLKKSYDELSDEAQAEFKKLQEENVILSQKRANIFEILEAYERGRAEAIKEFAERLKEKAQPHYFDNCNFAVPIDDIDNLLKEMTEEI